MRDMEEMEMSKIDKELEIKALRRVISAYLNYSVAAEEDVERWERSYSKLSPAHKEIVSHLPSKYMQLRRCISSNELFILNMIQAFEPPFDMGIDGGWNNTDLQNFMIQQFDIENIERKHHISPSEATGISSISSDRREMTRDLSCELQRNAGSFQVNNKTSEWFHDAFHANVPLADVDKVRCIIRNIVRDWAEEGKVERDECYKPILEELQLAFSSRTPKTPPTCLVPGAGLARLACEIARLGFMTQGNEFSYYMLICSSFILNCSQAPLEWAIHPWIHSNCNSLNDNNQLRAVYFPDLHPGSAGIASGFSMCAGDFVEVYSHPSQIESWDAIVTCFFLDTAHNIVEYIEVLSKILKPGGVWINFGPLLYHFSDSHSYSPEEEMSIELSLEDVKKVAFHYGLRMKKEETIETTYTANSQSMMQNRYFAAFWTMVKEK